MLVGLFSRVSLNGANLSVIAPWLATICPLPYFAGEGVHHCKRRDTRLS